MFLPARLFGSKNRRTPLQLTPRRLTGQSVDEQIRRLQSAWGDVLSLPMCLGALALYEWWRWLFSMPPNPLLLTIVAAVAIQATWRRRAVYTAELKLLRLGRGDEPTVAQAAVLLRLTAARLLQQIMNIPIPSTVLSSIRRALSPANGLAKRLAARW
jgi:hypothetical protein